MNRRSVNDGSGRIVVRNLAKRFGPVEAVRDLSFTVEPGQITGFLGPNGAGKTTTLRAALGLLTPTDGEVTVNGARYDQLAHPARVVGAVLDSNGFHRSRTARTHLRIYTAAIGVPDRGADEVLALVGLTDVANRKIGGFSLGMKQRLALATALLGDPQVLILDEPGSGLDPEGVAWLRSFMRSFAASGRTVLVSSHQLAEIAQTVDQVVIISQGTRVFEGRLEQLRGDNADRVYVRCSDPAKLATTLARQGFTDIQSAQDDRLTITGASATTVGDVALAAGVAIYGMAEERTDLEQRFLALTASQYLPRTPSGEPPVPPGALDQTFPPDAVPPSAILPGAVPPSAIPPDAIPPGAVPPSAPSPSTESPSAPSPSTAWPKQEGSR